MGNSKAQCLESSINTLQGKQKKRLNSNFKKIYDTSENVKAD